MLSRLLPALCAAMLLTACDTTGAAKTADTNGPQLADAPNGQVTPGEAEVGGYQNIGNTVYFGTDSYSLNAEAQAQLQKEAVWMQQYPQHTFIIEGHADERGTREYNLALGERRAEAVLNYLTALGISATRLKEVSYGKEKPVCVDSTETCWGQNRRGVTTVDN